MAGGETRKAGVWDAVEWSGVAGRMRACGCGCQLGGRQRVQLQHQLQHQPIPAPLTEETMRAVSYSPSGVSITGTNSSEKCIRMRSVAALQAREGRQAGRQAGVGRHSSVSYSPHPQSHPK